MIGLKNKKGISLVEAIISIAVFGIVAVAFLTLFSSALTWIYGAGDKGEAYSSAQQDVEGRIASEEAEYNPDLELVFGADHYSIRGGLVDTDRSVNGASSGLKAFVPAVPTIRINPMVSSEGEGTVTVTVTGYETSFDGSTVAELFDGTGTTKIGMTIAPTVTSVTEASLTLPSGLVNGDYIIRMTTTKSGEPAETVRAKYTVEQPKFLCAGERSVFISADGMYWVERSAYPGFPALYNLNAATYGATQYVAVGNGGYVLLSEDKQPYTSRIIGSEDLRGVCWSALYNSFYAVGARGGIYASNKGFDWLAMNTGSDRPLNDIHSTTFVSGSNILTAVGEGVILISYDGCGWSEVPGTGAVLRAVTSGYSGVNDLIVAAGDGLIASPDGINWSPVGPSVQFNDIAYNQGLGLFVAVGVNGLIMTSQDGAVWTDNSTGSANLNSVFTRGGSFIAVGDNGTILYSEDADTWSAVTAPVGVNLTAAAGK